VLSEGLAGTGEVAASVQSRVQHVQHRAADLAQFHRPEGGQDGPPDVALIGLLRRRVKLGYSHVPSQQASTSASRAVSLSGSGWEGRTSAGIGAAVATSRAWMAGSRMAWPAAVAWMARAMWSRSAPAPPITSTSWNVAASRPPG